MFLTSANVLLQFFPRLMEEQDGICGLHDSLGLSEGEAASNWFFFVSRTRRAFAVVYLVLFKETKNSNLCVYVESPFMGAVLEF